MGHHKFDWDWYKVLSQEAREDLRWIHNSISQVNGAPMWCPSQVARIQTDASGHSWGAVLLKSGQQARGYFKEVQSTWPIHKKEQNAVQQAVQTLCQNLYSQWVEFESDNMMVVSYLRDGGGRDPNMARMVKDIWQQLHQNGCAIYTAWWIRGATENQQADMLSRFIDEDDWELLDHTVELLKQNLSDWQVDRFADNRNRQCITFNSRFACPGCQAVDAFSQDWRGWWNLLVPPIPLIRRVLAHLIKCKAVGVLVVTQWPVVASTTTGVSQDDSLDGQRVMNWQPSLPAARSWWN